MPTHESAVAFAKLVEARERLTGITRSLNEANFPTQQIAQYRKLQAEWDEAYRAFEAATKEFSRIVESLKPPGVPKID